MWQPRLWPMGLLKFCLLHMGTTYQPLNALDSLLLSVLPPPPFGSQPMPAPPSLPHPTLPYSTYSIPSPPLPMPMPIQLFAQSMPAAWGSWCLRKFIHSLSSWKGENAVTLRTHFQIWEGKPTHTMVPCWMTATLSLKNRCMGCLAPALSVSAKLCLKPWSHLLMGIVGGQTSTSMGRFLVAFRQARACNVGVCWIMSACWQRKKNEWKKLLPYVGGRCLVALATNKCGYGIRA